MKPREGCEIRHRPPEWFCSYPSFHFGLWIADLRFTLIQNRQSRIQISSFTKIQFEPKTAALAHGALDEKPPVMHRLDNVLNQRESQTRAFCHPAVGLGSVKFIEDKLKILG